MRFTNWVQGAPYLGSLAQRLKELKCGVAVVDLRSGSVAAFLEFRTAVEEIFDVQILIGPRFPEVLGFQHETIQHTFIVPPESLARAKEGRIRVLTAEQE